MSIFTQLSIMFEVVPRCPENNMPTFAMTEYMIFTYMYSSGAFSFHDLQAHLCLIYTRTRMKQSRCLLPKDSQHALMDIVRHFSILNPRKHFVLWPLFFGPPLCSHAMPALPNLTRLPPAWSQLKGF